MYNEQSISRVRIGVKMFYEELFEKLNGRNIDYVVVGGVALVLHGVVRLTADL